MSERQPTHGVKVAGRSTEKDHQNGPAVLHLIVGRAARNESPRQSQLRAAARFGLNASLGNVRPRPGKHQSHRVKSGAIGQAMQSAAVQQRNSNEFFRELLQFILFPVRHRLRRFRAAIPVRDCGCEVSLLNLLHRQRE